LLLWAHAALAQSAFFDDFDDGGLSQWTNQFNPATVPYGAGIPDAGLIGNGFRVNDDSVATGSGSTMYLQHDGAGTGDQYVRAWVRLTPTSAMGTAHPMMIHNAAGDTIVELIWDQSAQQFFMQCFDSAGGSTYDPVAGDDGGWHLLELANVGAGTDAGTCAAAIDGVIGAREDARDFTGLAYGAVLLGEAWGELRFTGVLDFDDYRAGAAPLPSRIKVDLPSTADAGACVAARLEVQATFPGAVAAPVEPLPVVLHGASAFDDSQCTRPSAPLALAASAGQPEFFARFDAPGIADVWAETPDLLPLHSSVTVNAAEHTTPPEPGVYIVRCGCHEAAGPLLGAAALVWARFRRRARPRA
jgi:hypothetical protein